MQANEHTCRIEYLQQHYVQHCGCLNDYMPIPVKLSNYSSCFEWAEDSIFYILGKKVNDSFYTFNHEQRFVTKTTVLDSLEKLKTNFQCLEKWRKSAILEAKVEQFVKSECPKQCREDKYGVHVSVPYWLAPDSLGSRQDEDKAVVWLTKQVTGGWVLQCVGVKVTQPLMTHPTRFVPKLGGAIHVELNTQLTLKSSSWHLRLF